jgi:ferritin-like metal-binding protein YciE
MVQSQEKGMNRTPFVCSQQSGGERKTLRVPLGTWAFFQHEKSIFDIKKKGRKKDMTGKDLLIDWLNDAHGMENALIQILEHQIKDASAYPQVRAKLEQHLEQTRNHAELVKNCVETLGGSPSRVKTGMAKLFGQMQAVSTGAAKDEMVKNALADYAAENFEVASYTALIRAAQGLGDQHTASVCQQMLQEDQEMATWLQTNLPTLVQEVLPQVANR